MIIISNDLIREYAAYCGHARPEDGLLHLMGFRSCRLYPAGEGKTAISLVEAIPNSYDDLVGCFGMDLALFPGTVDPGRYYSQEPTRPDGCAHIVGIDEPEGRAYEYAEGLHKGNPAFVQAGSVVIWRDENCDMVQQPTEELPHDESGNGLNIHKMGDIAADVDKWSAGCQGVVDEDWDEFWGRATSAVPDQGQYLYWLMDAHRFAAWYDGDRRMAGGSNAADQIAVLINGAALEDAGYVRDDQSWVPVRPTTDAFSAAWKEVWHLGPITTLEDGTQRIALCSNTASYQVPLENRQGTGYVLATDLRASGVTVTWTAADKTVSLVG